MREKVIGILGGMGPEATIDLFTKIVKGTPARKDQEHLRILIDNNPKIPDRTKAIEGKGPSPVADLTRSARILQAAGADLLLIPCVTVHHFFGPLQRRIKIPILNIVEETVRYTRRRMKGIRTIGLIATTGTVRIGLFQKGFSEASIQVVLPAPETQRKRVMEAIYGRRGIKAAGPSTFSKNLVLRAAEELIEHGAEAVLAGCTEIPLVLREGDLPVPVIDPISILAGAAIRRAKAG
jgi:aspartate racemase